MPSDPTGAQKPEPSSPESRIEEQLASIARMKSVVPERVHRAILSELVHYGDDLRAWIGYATDEAGHVVYLMEYDDDRTVRLLRERHFHWKAYSIRIGPIVLTAGPGDSIGAGAVRGASGTFGCMATCGVTGAAMALTNDHVVGVTARRSSGDDVWSPSSARGGGSGSTIGTFDRGSSIQFGGVANKTDAALVNLSAPSAHRSMIPNPRNAPPTTVAAGFTFGDIGHKTGVATGYTAGPLIYIASFMVTYPGGRALFADQFVFDGNGAPYALQGDSGALVVSDANEAVGLLFSAAPNVGLGFVNPIGAVLNDLNATL